MTTLTLPIESMPKSDIPEDHVIVQVGTQNYRTEVNAYGFQMVADEPVSAGGQDLGPGPYGYLLSGLGACMAITVRMYSDRKGWPLEKIEMRLNHRKVNANECEECTTEVGKVDIIDVDIKFHGELDEMQLGRLFQIAGKCPVHRTLMSETVIRKKMI